jgi:hypothetical protein
MVATDLTIVPRNKGGRPKGSRNKPKPAEAQVSSVRPLWLQVADAARCAGVSVTTMRRWIRTDVVRHTKIGSAVLVSIASLETLGGKQA